MTSKVCKVHNSPAFLLEYIDYVNIFNCSQRPHCTTIHQIGIEDRIVNLCKDVNLYIVSEFSKNTICSA